VVLRDQADLSGSTAIASREERARYVYTSLTTHATASQAGLRADLDRFGIRHRPYYLVNALEVEGGPLVRIFLSMRPEVDRVLDAPSLRPLPEPMAEATGDMNAPGTPEWNITSIGADRVWSELGVTGRGIVVGQSDSGVDGAHPALRDGYRGRASGDSYNWLDPWNATPSPTDISGHGTHTLGSVLGRGGIGVAPGAEWFGCVNLARNLGNPALYLDCIQFMLAPYPQGADPFTAGDTGRGAHVTNNSWGCPRIEGCDETSLLPATMALRAAGIFVTVSAGNSGPRCGSVSDPPAIYDGTFSVGAVNERGNVTEFSSRGPATVEERTLVKPDIVAPGEDVLSSYPGGSYAEVSGTSMAGPHVAGVVALMWSAQPRLIGDIDRTEEILTSTARPYSGSRSNGCFEGSVPNNGFGYGIVDAYAAVKAAIEMK
jgi:subtilisin family serine protease